MKHMRYILLMALSLLLATRSLSQDPSFAQFFSSPLNVNPALTGNINSNWRLITNYRNQTSQVGFPYQTGTASFDGKPYNAKLPENHTLGMGGMFMYDKAMNGVLKSNYASFNTSYNLKIGGDESEHFLGAGIGFIYGFRRIDFSRLIWGEQFAGNGFNTNLPSGESALADMKQYLSVSAGVLYSIRSEFSNLDIGVAGFHLNKPRQSFLQDKNQVLPARYVVHANYELFLNEYVVLNTNGVYMQQGPASYFSIGGGAGYFLDDEGDKIVNAGLWYWSNNAVIPYVGFNYMNFQFGFSYDINISKLSNAPQKPQSFELSLIIRNPEKIKGIIPCPWK